MGIKERKAREKENLKKLIIDNAHNLLIQKGIEGLTMRLLADNIEYSQSKIYEFFANKDALCEAVCEELCNKYLAVLEKLPQSHDTESYLKELVTTTVEFHSSYPHSDALFTLVCFGPERFTIPPAFAQIEAIFIKALKGLNSPYLKSAEDINSALDVIRSIFISVSALINAETSLKGVNRALLMSKNAIATLIRGWR